MRQASRIGRMAAALGLVLSLVGMARAASHPTTQPARFVLATYNINWGVGWGLEEGKTLKTITETIHKAQADVVAIQEGNPAIFGHLRWALAKTYPHMQFYPASAAGGFAWLSKTPLRNMKVLPRKFGLFRTCLAEVEFGGKPTLLVNVHLQPILPPRTGSVREVLAMFAQTESIRVQEIESICAKLPEDWPVVLLGDFNSIPVQTVPAILRQRGFIDSFASVTPDANGHYTWRWGAGERQWKGRLDYIWHTSDFATVRSEVFPSDASDHYLLKSELEHAQRPSTRPATRPSTLGG